LDRITGERVEALSGPVSEHRQDPFVDVFQKLARPVAVAPLVEEAALEAALLALAIVEAQPRQHALSVGPRSIGMGGQLVRVQGRIEEQIGAHLLEPRALVRSVGTNPETIHASISGSGAATTIGNGHMSRSQTCSSPWRRPP
jgi:hypothetical protein